MSRRFFRRLARGSAAIAALGAAFALVGAGEPKQGPADPLAAEIDRWSAYLETTTSSDELWDQVKQAVSPLLLKARGDVQSGRRLIALLRLSAVEGNLSAFKYESQRPNDERRDAARFDAEWERVGQALRKDLGRPSPGAFDGTQPAAVRAVGEAALPAVRSCYDASRPYSRDNSLMSGLFYLGVAQAQRDLVAFCRVLSVPTSLRPPPVRSIRPEIDALQAEMLALYKPPASIDHHPEFISASSVLKEARELDEAGLRYGALLRYLLAVQRFSALRQPPAVAGDALAEALRDFDARLSRGDVDHSIGRVMFEAAQSDIASAAPGAPTPLASAVAADVLPRYFAALEPARPEAPRPAPEVTVTLVRWPYT
jgi:hypothetical protein